MRYGRPASGRGRFAVVSGEQASSSATTLRRGLQLYERDGEFKLTHRSREVVEQTPVVLAKPDVLDPADR